jgi:hypothetical protein
MKIETFEKGEYSRWCMLFKVEIMEFDKKKKNDYYIKYNFWSIHVGKKMGLTLFFFPYLNAGDNFPGD